MRTNAPVLSALALCLFVITSAWSQTPTVPSGPTVPSPSVGGGGGAGGAELVAPLIPGEEYLLGPGDSIYVTFYGETEMNRDCSIRGDGSIFLAMLREKIPAAGKTTEQLQQVIEEAYRSEKLLKNPLVTVSIREFRSAPVTVTGYVSRPVTIQVQGKTTLLQAVTMAGGLSQAAATKILISHAAAKDAAGMPVPGGTMAIQQRDLMDHPDDPKINVTLRGGDIVTVQRTDYVYVGGAVVKPGMLPMNEVDSWTVLKALSAVGNLTRVAKKDASVILRKKEDGTTEQIPLDLAKILNRKNEDVVLRANDVLLIPESTGLKAMYAAASTLQGVTGGVVTGLTIR